MILILFYFSFISLEDLDCCNQSWRLIAIFLHQSTHLPDDFVSIVFDFQVALSPESLSLSKISLPFLILNRSTHKDIVVPCANPSSAFLRIVRKLPDKNVFTLAVFLIA